VQQDVGRCSRYRADSLQQGGGRYSLYRVGGVRQDVGRCSHYGVGGVQQDVGCYCQSEVGGVQHNMRYDTVITSVKLVVCRGRSTQYRLGSEQQGVVVTDGNGQRTAKMWELVCSEWVAGSKIWDDTLSLSAVHGFGPWDFSDGRLGASH
jgi:hypothetical protein